MSPPDWRDEGGASALFTRDGHALGLALERLVAGELDDAAAGRLSEHLAACPPCQARRAELDLPLPVPLGPRSVVASPSASTPSPARPAGPVEQPSASTPSSARSAAPVELVSSPSPARPAEPAELPPASTPVSARSVVPVELASTPSSALSAEPVELPQPANLAGTSAPDAEGPSTRGPGPSGDMRQRPPSGPPGSTLDATAPRTAVSWRRAGAWATAAALAASLWVVLRPAAPERPEFHLRGGGLGLEVFRQTAGASEPLVDGSAARAGDTLGFRVQVRRDGFALVAGVDGEGEVYPVWPAAPPHEAVPVEASADPRALDVAIRLDAAPGDERMVLVFCEAAFRLDGVRAAVAAGGALPKGCTQRTVRLTKAGDP